MKTKIHFKLFTIFTILILFGCSGSGTSQKNTSKYNYPIKTLSLDELTNQSIDIPNHATKMLINKKYKNVKLNFNNKKLNIDIGNINKLITEKINFENDNKQVVFQIILNIKNNSASYLIKKSNEILNQKKALTNLSTDKKIYFYILDIAYLRKKISYNDKQFLYNNFTPLQQSNTTKLWSAYNKLSSLILNYKKGLVLDTTIKKVFDNLVNLSIEHEKYGIKKINEIKFLFPKNMPDLTFGPLKYSKQSNVFSRFIGNKNYGYYKNKKWNFYKKYSFLNYIVNKNDMENEICKI